jgi:hypothetical protein
MPIVFDCVCGKRYRVKDSGAGRAFSCQACGQDLIVPVPDAVDLGIVTDVPLAGVRAPGVGHRQNYEYRMVQVPPTISVREGVSHGRKAAGYLEEVVNEHAAQGWDFFRVDTIGIWVEPGCIRSLLAVPPQLVQYYVITFRRAPE